MCSSLAFGYLKLESDRWLTRHDPEGDSLELLGVSFANVSTAVRSMVDLGDWKVRTVPPSDRMPEFLAMLTSLVPILGVGLHESGLHGGLEAGFNGRLWGLITEMEKEDWGIDLARISH